MIFLFPNFYEMILKYNLSEEKFKVDTANNPL